MTTTASKTAAEWALDISSAVTEEDWETTMAGIVHSLLCEYIALVDSRGKTPNACLGAAKQLNDKWNAITRKVKRSDGQNLVRDGFLKYLDAETSGMFQMHLTKRRIDMEQKRTNNKC
jgi:hypothetical protein